MTPLQQMDAEIAEAEARLSAKKSARALMAKMAPLSVVDFDVSASWTLDNAQERLLGLGYAQVLRAWEALWDELSTRKPLEPRSREIHAMVEQIIAPAFQRLAP